jgi:DNA phosphorothioation-dependent restriction protein DptH
MWNILAAAFANCLGRHTDYRLVTLPDGLGTGETSLAAQLVQALNHLPDPESQWKNDYAVFVTASGTIRPRSGHLSLRPSEALKYRVQPGRLIVAEDHPGLSSLAKSFAAVLTKSYPSGATSPVALEQLALAAIQAVTVRSGVENFIPSNGLLERATHLFRYLEHAYEELGSTDATWNRNWFVHVGSGLNQVAFALDRAPSDADLDGLLTKALFPCFSLPSPTTGNRYEGGKKLSSKHDATTGKRIKVAVEDWWSSTEQVTETVALLGRHPDSSLDPHPIASIDWTALQSTAVSELARNSPLLAFALHELEADLRWESFAALTERQFFAPMGSAAPGRLRVFDAHETDLHGTDLSVSELETDIAFITGTKLDSSHQYIESPGLRIAIPCTSAATPEQVEQSNIRIKTSLKSLTFVSDELVVADGVLEVRGRLRQKVAASGFTYAPRPRRLSIQLDASDPLKGIVDKSAGASVVLLPPDGVGCLLFERKKGGLKKPSIIGPTSYSREGLQTDADRTFAHSLSGGQSYSTLVWANGVSAAFTINGVTVDPLSDREEIATTDFPAAGDLSIQIGPVRIELATTTDNPPLSPLVAAIRKVSHSTAEPETELVESLRGDLETIYANGLAGASESLRNRVSLSLGHIALPTDRRLKIEHPELVGSAILTISGLSQDWYALGNYSVSEALLASNEVQLFRSSLENLNLVDSLCRSDADGNRSVRWPSQSSWEHLADSQKLDDYLKSYSIMVARARELGDPFGVFWATYPFSASLWDTSPALSCKSVLLSPIHPIRLAWLARTERTLRNASNATLFAGAVEGWNLPVVGTGPAEFSRLMAIPAESGFDQLFLGWSLLTDASLGAPATLCPPEFAGNRRVPGSAASGLNGGAVAAAMSDFRRMHPFVSTLTIDLAASSRGPRLDDIDTAVLQEVSKWAGRTGEGLPGGVRVSDSLNRLGPIPYEALQRLIGEHSDVPVTWSRYDQSASEMPEANIRFLQDAGMAVSVGVAGSDQFGAIAEVPLRRVEVPDPTVGNVGAAVLSQPGLCAPQANSYSAALHSAEAVGLGDGVPEVKVQLLGAALVSNDSDWTVSGESMVSPAALAKLLDAAPGADQMLWEWRPPFFDADFSSKNSRELERRPYVSVVRVPSEFLNQLKDKINLVIGRQPSEEEIDEVLRVLGSRGVGLSSLVAMGGQHSTGALGFFATLQLMSHSAPNGCARVVLPIDVCNGFLQALGGDFALALEADDRRRADLLVVDLADDAVTLTPIEIKFYNINDPAPSLPQPDSGKLEEPVRQLASTMLLLEAIKNQWAVWKASPDCRRLAGAGLASLVEAGLRLNPEPVADRQRTAQTINRILEGDIGVDVGRPVVAYFTRCSSDETFATFREVQSDQIASPFGALIASSGEALPQVLDSQSPLATAWNELMTWATVPFAGSEDIRPIQSPEGGSGLGANSAPPNGPSGPAANTTSKEPPEPAEEADTAESDQGTEKGSTEVTDPTKSRSDMSASNDGDGPTLKETPSETPALGVRITVGETIGTVKPTHAYYWPSNTALNQLNIGVVGDLGTGKTQFLKSLIYQIRTQAAAIQPTPVSFLIFDYKRDFQDEQFLEAVGGETLKPHRIPLNVLSSSTTSSQATPFQKANSFKDVIAKIFPNIGAVQKDRLVETLIELYSSQETTPTLSQLRTEYKNKIGQGSDGVTAALNAFVLGEVFSDDVAEIKPFSELVEDRVLVVDLASLGADQDMKNALVILFLNQYYEYMLSLRKWPYSGTDPQLRRLNSFLLVDEATNIMEFKFDVLEQLLLQGREFGVGVVLSSQYLSHFNVPGTNYAEPLRTWVVHRVPNVSAQDLSKLGVAGATDAEAGRISELPNHQAFYSTYGFNGRFIVGLPFFKLRPDAG